MDPQKIHQRARLPKSAPPIFIVYTHNLHNSKHVQLAARRQHLEFRRTAQALEDLRAVQKEFDAK